MNNSQKKKLEEQLRKLMAEAEEPSVEEQPAQTKPGNIRVIRRRRGEPDLLIA